VPDPGGGGGDQVGGGRAGGEEGTMSQGTGIEWTDATWNPVVGCTPVSPGCLNCYAATMARRLEAMGRPEYVGLTVKKAAKGANGAKAANEDDGDDGARKRAVFSGTVRCLDERLLEPLNWRKPRRVFVCSMADLFHEAVPFEFIDKVFAVMALSHRHTFQVLTKRPERMREYLVRSLNRRHIAVYDAATQVHPDWFSLNHTMASHRSSGEGWWPLRNVWLGTSVEDQERLRRAWELLDCPAAVRFLSCEPLLGPVDLNALELLCGSWRRGATIGTYLDWVIVGGESGASARPCDVAWVRSIVQQCQAAGVPVFVKQLGRWIGGDNSTFPLNGLVDQWLFENGGTFTTPILRSDLATGPDYRHERPAGAIAFRVEGGAGNVKHGDPAKWPEDLRVREFPLAGLPPAAQAIPASSSSF
jgi:protein gp37